MVESAPHTRGGQDAAVPSRPTGASEDPCAATEPETTGGSGGAAADNVSTAVPTEGSLSLEPSLEPSLELSLEVSRGLGALVHTLDGAATELFAAAPFPGEPRTGRQIDGYVDDAVAALRALRTTADDLDRTLTIARSTFAAPDPEHR